MAMLEVKLVSPRNIRALSGQDGHEVFPVDHHIIRHFGTGSIGQSRDPVDVLGHGADVAPSRDTVFPLHDARYPDATLIHRALIFAGSVITGIDDDGVIFD